MTQHLFLCPLPRKTLEASAICRYDLAELQAVFAGPYMEYQDGARRWGRYEGGVPEPRPGSVSPQVWGRRWVDRTLGGQKDLALGLMGDGQAVDC